MISGAAEGSSHSSGHHHSHRRAFAYNAEELKAILRMKSKHVLQISDVINQPTSLFAATLAAQVGFQSDDYTDLAELEGHCTDLTDSGVSWLFRRCPRNSNRS